MSAASALPTARTAAFALNRIIDRHIDALAGVLKANGPRLRDAGVKVAIENHAGDMQARELKRLVETAGPDIVGVCLDSGNPVWTIEDPHLTLDTLAPYVLTSHMRDSALWRVPEGVAVRWTQMGEGNMGMEDYLRTYIEKCPGKAVSLEVIVSPNPRIVRYADPKFWDIYRNTPAWEFARFIALCDKGQPSVAAPPAAGRRRRSVNCRRRGELKWTQDFSRSSRSPCKRAERLKRPPEVRAWRASRRRAGVGPASAKKDRPRCERGEPRGRRAGVGPRGIKKG
jgi:hypothetical protein